MEDVLTGLELPGFRFHPTEEELLDFYLKNTVYGIRMHFEIIGSVNIYHHDPWDLPGLARVGEREWYFFVPRDKKHGNGGRPNRTTGKGFWKATGSDKRITKLSDHKLIGLRKTLVFYQGRAPGGKRTDWIMNEYRLPDSLNLPKDMVLCKIYRKATSLKVMEERAESMKEVFSFPPSSSLSPPHAISFTGHFWDESISSSYPQGMPLMKFEGEINVEDHINEFDHIFKGTSTSYLTSLSGKADFGQVQTSSFELDWPQESGQYLDSIYHH